jgi:hypothetical protein
MAETSVYAAWRDVPREEPDRHPRTVLERMRGWMHKMRSDAELVRIAQTGDTQAFDELVTRFRNRIYTLVANSLRNPSDVADVVCEVFVTAYRRLGWFDRSCSPATWFTIIALKSVLDRLRGSWGDYTLEWRRGA